MHPISDNAINFVRNRATELMGYTCRIERVQRASFNETTGTASPGSRITIYEGPCRVWESSGGAPMLVSEEEVVMQSTQLSIPWDVEDVPRRNDEVQITGSQTDDYMVGKRFTIDSSAKAGELRATRRFQISGIQR